LTPYCDAAARDGRFDQARESYARLLDLWSDCDPSLHAERDEVESALAALPD